MIRIIILLMICLFQLMWIRNTALGQIETVPQKPVSAGQVKYAYAGDSLAGFKGGNEALFSHITARFEMHDTTFTGPGKDYYLAVFSFVVDSTGRVSDIKPNDTGEQSEMIPEPVMKSLLLTLGQMPEWNPGMKDNSSVSSLVYLPLRFKIEKGKIIISGKDQLTEPKKKTGWTPAKVVLIAGAAVIVIAVAFLGIF